MHSLHFPLVLNLPVDIESDYCLTGNDIILIGLEYVRYGIEMKMEMHKAIRIQHKNYRKEKK